MATGIMVFSNNLGIELDSCDRLLGKHMQTLHRGIQFLLDNSWLPAALFNNLHT